MTPDFGVIALAISAQTGRPFQAASIMPVSGGSIHRAWQIADGSRRFFVKTNGIAAAAMFDAEALGLDALAATATIRIPTVITRGIADSYAFLVLEHLDLKALDGNSAAQLGTALAQLHRRCGPEYGWHADNFIGATPQRNTGHPSWPHFFGECRLRPQLQLALERGMEKALVARGNTLIELIGGLFIDYRPLPSLLHGDLWSGNAAQTADGTATVFDPACYFGDRETDVAMTELFGGFPSAFYAAYRAAWPLDPGYEMRKPLYNLYHILNHFNLFGGAYLGEAGRLIERLLKTLQR